MIDNTIDTMKITSNTIKWIRIGIEGAFLLTFILLCVAVGVKNKTIKRQKATIKAQTETVDSLQNRCDRLGAVDCITVETSCIINNKGLVNVAQTNQISKTVATYTRDEVLAAMDSLNNLK